MDRIDAAEHRRVDRRTFLKGTLIGGALAGAGLAIGAATDSDRGSPAPSTRPSLAAGPPAPSARSDKPNILVIVVDQLRFPQWFSPDPSGAGLPPNLRRLREGAVSFGRHYTASNDCTPARAALLTGLYTHQTGCMITGGSTLDPGFPTWGTMLREHGYSTRWWASGTSPMATTTGTRSPANGARALWLRRRQSSRRPTAPPGQGWRVDPHIARSSRTGSPHEGGASRGARPSRSSTPTTSPGGTCGATACPARPAAARVVPRLPPNFETPELLLERRKPRLQRSLQETAAASFGPVPFSGPEASETWLSFLDLYIQLQLEVDRHIGHVMRTLESRPEVAANTVILFTSDHGEYGASHGLRGKGASAYEEGIRVPLLVKDPRGQLTSAPEQTRTQLTSSVDIAPLLLTIATGSDRLAPRSPLLAHRATARPREHPRQPRSARSPVRAARHRRDRHRVRDRALRRRRAAAHRRHAHPAGQVRDLLELALRRDRAALGRPGKSSCTTTRTQSGRLELHNGAGQSPLEEALRGESRARVQAGAARARCRRA